MPALYVMSLLFPGGVLSGRNIVLVLGGMAVVAAVFQVGFDVDPVVLFLALSSIAIGLYSFWLTGPMNLAGWVLFVYMAGNILVAYYAKTLMGQPLESNLYNPQLAFAVEAICCLSLFVALILTIWIPVGKPAVKPILERGTLRFLGFLCYLIGLAILALQFFVVRLGTLAYGGLDVFGGLLYFGIICRTALVMLRSDFRRTMDPVLFFMLLLPTCSGFLSTGKTEIAMPGVCYFLTILYFKGKLPKRHLVLAGIAIMLFLVISPILLTFRYMGLRNLPLNQEIEYFEAYLPMLLDPAELAILRSKYEVAHKSVFYDYYGGGRNQLVLGRFSSVQQIDPVIDAIDARGTLGPKVIIDSLRKNLPKAIDPDKPQEIVGFTIVTGLGLSSPRQGGYPTVPMAAIVYAAYGLPGVLVIPFLTFLLYLLVLKKVGWDLRSNVFAIYILAYWVISIAWQDLAHFEGLIVRDIPLTCLIVLAIKWVYELRTQQQRAASQASGRLIAPLLPERDPFLRRRVTDTDTSPLDGVS
ncbi:MAG: hypothetical protein WA869_15790 [Alloacidobacterium sp.]